MFIEYFYGEWKSTLNDLTYWFTVFSAQFSWLYGVDIRRILEVELCVEQYYMIPESRTLQIVSNLPPLNPKKTKNVLAWTLWVQEFFFLEKRGTKSLDSVLFITPDKKLKIVTKNIHCKAKILQYSIVQYSTVYTLLQYCTVQYTLLQYCTVQYTLLQYSTVHTLTALYSTQFALKIRNSRALVCLGCTVAKTIYLQ